jgi:hypothetical protein
MAVVSQSLDNRDLISGMLAVNISKQQKEDLSYVTEDRV